jgi:2-hydroxy-6-oxonona-2,4-dienedioate hydrolase
MSPRIRLFAIRVITTIALMLAASFSFAQTSDGSIAGLKSKFADVNGVHARYYETGKGEPMVLIHGGFTGGSSTANVWSRNIAGLSQRYRVFAIDRLGSGLTGNPPNDDQFNYKGDADFVYAFIQQMKLGPVHLVGHSAGGAVAFYLAIEHPDAVKTLTIVAHGPENPPATAGDTRLTPLLKKCPDQTQYDGLKCRVAMLAWLDNTFDDEYWNADVYMANTEKSKQAREKIAAGAGEPLRTKEYAAWREKMWDRVRNDGVLQMPVLLYAGKNDVLDWGIDDATAKMSGELGLFDIIGAKNPRVQMMIVNEGGHFMYREHPEQFNHDLTGFIDFWAHQPKPGPTKRMSYVAPLKESNGQ